MISLTKKFLILLTLGLGAGAQAAEPAPAPSPDAPIMWLAGGTWKATLPPDEGKTVQIELVAVRPENHRGVMFHSTFIIDGQRRPYTSGMYAWDAAKKKFAIFYTDASGSLSAGDVAVEGNVLAHEFTVTSLDGKVEPVRVRLTKLGAGAFTNEIFVQKDGAWAPFVTVRYERSE